MRFPTPKKAQQATNQSQQASERNVYDAGKDKKRHRHGPCGDNALADLIALRT